MANPGNTVITLATSTTSTQVAVSTSILDFKIRKVLNLGVDYFEGTFKSPMSPTPTVGNMLVVTTQVKGSTITEYIGEVYDVTYENRNTRIKARTYSYKLAIANDSFAGATDPEDMIDKAVAKAGITVVKRTSWAQNYTYSPMYDAQCGLIAVKRATEYPVADGSYPTAFYPSPGAIASITVDASGSGTPDSGITLTYSNGLVATPNFTTRGDSVVDYVIVQGLESGISATVGAASGRSEVLYRQEYISSVDCTQVAEALYTKLSVNRVKVTADVKFASLFPATPTDIDTPINKLYTVVDSTQRTAGGAIMSQQAALTEYTLKYPSLIASCVFNSPFIDYNDFVPDIDTRVSQLERTPSSGTSKVFIVTSTTVRMSSTYSSSYVTAGGTYVKGPNLVNLSPTAFASAGIGSYTCKCNAARNVQNGQLVFRRYSSTGTLMEESAAQTINSSSTSNTVSATMNDFSIGDTIQMWVRSTGSSDFFWASALQVMYDYKTI